VSLICPKLSMLIRATTALASAAAAGKLGANAIERARRDAHKARLFRGKTHTPRITEGSHTNREWRWSISLDGNGGAMVCPALIQRFPRYFKPDIAGELRKTCALVAFLLGP
jgi:hypothetical protein